MPNRARLPPIGSRRVGVWRHTIVGNRFAGHVDVAAGPGGQVTAVFTTGRGAWCVVRKQQPSWTRPTCRARKLFNQQIILDVGPAGRTYVMTDRGVWSAAAGHRWHSAENIPGRRLHAATFGPSISLDASSRGRAAVMWAEGDPPFGPLPVFVTVRRPGGTWTRARLADDFHTVSVAITGNGTTYAAWSFEFAQTWVARKVPGRPWRHPVQVGGPHTEASAIAANDAGKALLGIRHASATQQKLTASWRP